MANTRLLIVDPDINYRTDLKKQLQRASIDVVGEASYGADAMSLIASLKPDAVAVAVTLLNPHVASVTVV